MTVAKEKKREPIYAQYWEIIECARVLHVTPKALLQGGQCVYKRQAVWILLKRWGWSVRQIAAAFNRQIKFMEWALADADIARRAQPLVDAMDGELSGGISDEGD